MAGLFTGASAPELPADSGTAASRLQVLVALRTLDDISACVDVLSRYDFSNIEPAVLQMLQQRIFDLAHGGAVCLRAVQPAWAVHAELYPSEPVLNEGGAE